MQLFFIIIFVFIASLSIIKEKISFVLYPFFFIIMFFQQREELIFSNIFYTKLPYLNSLYLIDILFFILIISCFIIYKERLRIFFYKNSMSFFAIIAIILIFFMVRVVYDISMAIHPNAVFDEIRFIFIFIISFVFFFIYLDRKNFRTIMFLSIIMVFLREIIALPYFLKNQGILYPSRRYGLYEVEPVIIMIIYIGAILILFYNKKLIIFKKKFYRMNKLVYIIKYSIIPVSVILIMLSNRRHIIFFSVFFTAIIFFLKNKDGILLKKKLSMREILIFLIIIFALVIPFLLSLTARGRLSDSYRIEEYSMGIQTLCRAKFTGIGFGNYIYWTGNYKYHKKPIANVHNIFLWILLKGGFPALLLFIFTLVYYLVYIYKRKHETLEEIISFLYIIFLIFAASVETYNIEYRVMFLSGIFFAYPLKTILRHYK